ncbi:MAG: nucleotidyltransferase domain-containing protein [Eubacterium sp.]|nr:nucleotidyltransferase domain-containing protein [Eubacterium sp.]
MKETGIRPTVLAQIQEIARQYGTAKVILFGSRARGDFQAKSDIDLAVQGGNVAGFALDVDELTDTLLRYDIIDLNAPLSDAFAKEIERDGLILYEKI